MKKILSIEDPSKKRAMFIALLSSEVVRRGGKAPIVVGGEAVEIYTQGSYTTGDIDIKSPLEITKSVLKEWGFSKKGRTWFNEALDIYIDWLGASLDEGQEAEERVSTIWIARGLEIKVISIEDLVIDRLNAAKYWGDVDSLMWARALLDIKKRSGERIETKYLRRRAKKEGITDLLSKALSPKARRQGK